MVRVYANDSALTDVAYIRGLNLIASRTDAAVTYYYLRARCYAPGTGRFTQADTHWNPGKRNATEYRKIDR